MSEAIGMVSREEWAEAQRKHRAWLANKEDGNRLMMLHRDFSELKSVDLEAGTFKNAYLYNCDFMAKSGYRVNFESAEIHNCDFSRSIFHQWSFYKAQLENCSFKGTSMRKADMRYTRVYCCDFSDARLEESDWQGVSIQHCNFKATRIHGANLIVAGYNCAGYLFFAYKQVWDEEAKEHNIVIKAGCREFHSIEDALKHWRRAKYKAERTPEEYQSSISLVRRIKELAKAKGWLP